jgi:hypothetical protein
MTGIRLTFGAAGFLLALVFGVGVSWFVLEQNSNVANAQGPANERVTPWRPQPRADFDLQVLVDGRPLAEYYARGKTYIEALKGAEYELRVRNPTSDRVAVALSVDGLNTIDARHSSAWNSSKWVIEPYQSITIGGWQMSTAGAKLGQTANLGNISAVVFRERRRSISIDRPRPMYPDDRDRSEKEKAPSKPTESQAGNSAARSSVPVTNDDYAATGIGRSVRNDVRWVDMELESQPAGELTIRYEYYSALLKLGVVPPRNIEPYPIRRREDSRGFSPEP